MSDALETLLLLCRCLRPEIADGQRINTAPWPDDKGQWTALIALANAHYLTPALGLALKQKGREGNLPASAHSFLETAVRLNRARNQSIQAQAIELIGALQEARIRSIVLKGGAYLFDGNQDAFDTRMMVDIDLLVPKQDLEDSFEIARSIGYRVLSTIDPRLHHLDPIGQDGAPASVEIHKDAGLQRLILPAEEIFRTAIPFDVAGTHIFIPSPTHRAIHSIFQSEVQAQNNYALGQISLRYLHDMMLLRCQHDTEIDWPEVQNSLARQGYGHIVPGFLHLLSQLLDNPMPAGIPLTPAAKRHYSWCMAQMTWPALRAMVSAWGAVAHPFRRPPIEYVYGESPSPLVLQGNRLRYLRDLALTHKGSSFQKLSSVFNRMFKI